MPGRIIAAALLALIQGIVHAALPSFPGAEGFGATTPGGRGGRVILVTNLEDAGPGSLRAACEAEGPRIVVFRVGGVIELQSDIRVTNPYLTIAGQTAPGGGICLKSYSLYIRDTHDVVVRHLRVRPGDVSGKAVDAITVYLSQRVVLDHCSTSWAIDEVLSATMSQDVTVQWCMITESLHDSVHPKGPHGMGSLFAYNGEGGISVHHCVYAHHNARSPRPGGMKDMPGFTLDFRNNVIYNWGNWCGYNDTLPQKITYVGNHLRPGPSTAEKVLRTAFLIDGVANSFYAADNIMDGYPEATADNWLMMRFSKNVTREAVDAGAPHPAPPITMTPTRDLLAVLVEGCGATLPRRDAVDARVLDEICSGRGRIINSQTEVGGWPDYAAGEAPPDADEDGMPDPWETARGLNPNDPADASEDADGDGYTNIEAYINGL